MCVYVLFVLLTVCLSISVIVAAFLQNKFYISKPTFCHVRVNISTNLTGLRIAGIGVSTNYLVTVQQTEDYARHVNTAFDGKPSQEAFLIIVYKVMQVTDAMCA